MADNKKLVKMALVSGASHALKFKRENRFASDEDAIQHVTRESEEILKKLDSEN